MRKNVFVLFTCLLLCASMAMAQVTKVTGTVTSSEDGLPVVGASVLVEGTATGTITNVDGKFVIDKLPAGSKAVIVSFLGMKTQRVEIKSGNLVIVLKSDSELLDEVVVTAMGISKQAKTLGYAASSAKAEELTVAKSGSLMSGLQGKMAGVQITGGVLREPLRRC